MNDQAGGLAAITTNKDAINQVFNVAVGNRTTLNELFFGIRDLIALEIPEVRAVEPLYGEFRVGDVRHSQADISKAEKLLGYVPTFDVAAGLKVTAQWFLAAYKKDNNAQ